MLSKDVQKQLERTSLMMSLVLTFFFCVLQDDEDLDNCESNDEIPTEPEASPSTYQTEIGK